MLEIFLQMNKSTRGLDQSFKKIIIGRVLVQPNLLEDVMRLVVTLLVPAPEKSPIIRVAFHCVARGTFSFFPGQPTDESRNPLAFVHEEPTLLAAQQMSKLAVSTLQQTLHPHRRTRRPPK